MMNSANGEIGTLQVILLSVAAGAMAAGCGAGSSQADSESETVPVAYLSSEASGEIVGSPSNVVIENNEFEGLTIDLDSYPTETTSSTDFATPHSLMAAVSHTSVEPLEIGDEEALEIVETGMVTQATEPLVLGANPETASTDNDQETNSTLSLDAPVQLYPVDGDMIGLGEPVLFSWIVSAALQSSTIAFDISIHSKDDSSTVFRNNALGGALCNSSGNCEWSLSSELPIEQGKNYEWHISVSSGDLSSPKSVADFDVLLAEPIEVEIASNQEVTSSEPDSGSTGRDDTDTPKGANYYQAKAAFDYALSQEPSWYTTNVTNLRGQATTEAYYHRIQAFHGLVIAYELTGDISYLQKGVDLAMSYVNAGTDRDGDGYWDWLWGHKSDPNRINHDHYEWRSASGIAAVAVAVHDANAAGVSVTPSNALSKMTTMLEKHLWEKWSAGNQPTGKSWLQGTTGSGGNSRISTIAMALHQITGNSKYSSFLNGRPTEMIETMIDSYDPATNSMDINVKTNGSSFSYDVSHAEDVIMMLDHARRHGYTFGGRVDATFYQRLADTLKNVMWTGQYLTYRVDGSGNGRQTSSPDEYVTTQVAAWSLLTIHDEQLFQKALNHANTDSTITDAVTSTVTHERRMLLFAALMRSAAAFD